MSWLRIFEAYRDLEAEKVAAEARAEFLQDQVSQLQARVETLDERSQQAQSQLLADREKVADMFAVRVMEEGVYDQSRQHPAMKRAGGSQPIPAPGPQRIPAHLVARALTKKAFEDDHRRMQEEAAELQKVAEEQLGLKLGPVGPPVGKEGTADAQASAG
jgi:uncharacterized protein (DUF3084 family)